jgi:thioredoxin reductase
MLTIDFIQEQKDDFICLISDSPENINKADTVNDNVKSINLCSSGSFRITTAKELDIRANIVVIATGTGIEAPSIPNLEINSCFTFKDYPFEFLKNSDKVLLIGAGHTASETLSIILPKVRDVMVIDINDEKHNRLNNDRKQIFHDSKVRINFDSGYKLGKNG